MFFPLSRLRRQLSQRESQVPRAMHYTERCIEVPLCYLFAALRTPTLGGVFVRQLTGGCAPFLYAMAQLQAASLALPLGELSPKVTERALQAVLNGDIN